MAILHRDSLPLAAPDGTVILMKGADSPWALDLNTLVTVVFGVIGIAFQAWQVYLGRRHRLISRRLGICHEADKAEQNHIHGVAS